LTAALKQAAVDQVFSAVIDEKVGAGHATGGPETGNLHQVYSFGFSIKILREKNGLPVFRLAPGATREPLSSIW
jgi:hypothetical protein